MLINGLLFKGGYFEGKVNKHPGGASKPYLDKRSDPSVSERHTDLESSAACPVEMSSDIQY